MRIMLLMAICDLPERAKIGGLPHHSSKGRPCPNCTVPADQFALAVTSPFPPRDGDKHRADSLSARRQGKIKGSDDELFRRTDARYTSLAELWYWRSPSMMPPDPMHAMHLGVPKRMFRDTLIFGGIASDDDLLVFAQIWTSIRVPSGSANARLDPLFGTAAGGKGTAVQYSTSARCFFWFGCCGAWAQGIDSGEDLTAVFNKPKGKAVRRTAGSFGIEASGKGKKKKKGKAKAKAKEMEKSSESERDKEKQGETREPPRIIDKRHFMRACLYLASILDLCDKSSITSTELDRLDWFIRTFTCSMLDMFGPKWLTINGHLLSHSPAFIRLYGSPKHWSAYAFESVHGILGQYNSNKRRNGGMEATLTKTFAQNAQINSTLQHWLAAPDAATRELAAEMLDAATADDAAKIMIMQSHEVRFSPDNVLTSQYPERVFTLSTSLKDSALGPHVYAAHVSYLKRQPALLDPHSSAQIYNCFTRYSHLIQTSSRRRLVSVNGRKNAACGDTLAFATPFGCAEMKPCEIVEIYASREAQGCANLFVAVRWSLPAEIDGVGAMLYEAEWGHLGMGWLEPNRYTGMEVISVESLGPPLARVEVPLGSRKLWGYKSIAL